MKNYLKSLCLLLLASSFYTQVCMALDEDLQKHLESTDYHSEVVVGFPLNFDRMDYEMDANAVLDPSKIEELNQKTVELERDLVAAKIAAKVGYVVNQAKLKFLRRDKLFGVERSLMPQEVPFNGNGNGNLSDFPNEWNTATYFLVQINSKAQAQRLDPILEAHQPVIYKNSIAESSLWITLNEQLRQLKESRLEIANEMEFYTSTTIAIVEGLHEALRVCTLSIRDTLKILQKIEN